jgi:hypothetical protein
MAAIRLPGLMIAELFGFMHWGGIVSPGFLLIHPQIHPGMALPSAQIWLAYRRRHAFAMLRALLPDLDWAYLKIPPALGLRPRRPAPFELVRSPAQLAPEKARRAPRARPELCPARPQALMRGSAALPAAG